MIALVVAPTLGLSAPAPSTMTGPSAQDTVNSLKGQGNRVIVNKVGNGPLSQCTVSGVRRGHEVRSLPPRIFHRAPNYSTVYVDVVCG
jgi:hypothetical protein